MDSTNDRSTPRNFRRAKAASVVGVVALLGVAAVPALGAMQGLRPHGEVAANLMAGRSPENPVGPAADAKSDSTVNNSATMVYSIPEASTLTTAPYVIGLENFAVRAVSRHKESIMVSAGASRGDRAAATSASREDIAVAILKSTLASLHSRIVVTVVPPSHHVTGLTFTS